MSLDAFATMQDTLNQYDLGGLAPWAWNNFAAGFTQDQILLMMHDQPLYQQRFPYEKAMRDAGLPVLSPAEMLSLESQYKQIQQSYGMTPSNNPSDYVGLFTGQTSPNEFQNRLDMFHQIRTVYSPYIRQQFETQAGITNVKDEDLYNLFAGTDTSLAQKYADSTGTPLHLPSFADLQTAQAKALALNKAEFAGGGQEQNQPPDQSPEQVVSAKQMASF